MTKAKTVKLNTLYKLTAKQEETRESQLATASIMPSVDKAFRSFQEADRVNTELDQRKTYALCDLLGLQEDKTKGAEEERFVVLGEFERASISAMQREYLAEAYAVPCEKEAKDFVNAQLKALREVYGIKTTDKESELGECYNRFQSGMRMALKRMYEALELVTVETKTGNVTQVANQVVFVLRPRVFRGILNNYQIVFTSHL